MLKSLAVFVLAVFVAGLTIAGAEEKHGVQVYPGAKYDAETSQAVNAAMKVDGACYRTAATPVQVNEFYK